MTPDTARCAVCRRPATATVCGDCQRQLAVQLDAIVPSVRKLSYALVPSRMGMGGGHGGPTPEAPLSARLDPLSMLAVGSDEARCAFIPKVRQWSTIEHHVENVGTEFEYVTVFHRERVADETGRTAMTLVDDQAGSLPVRAWLLGWERDWRDQLHNDRCAPADTGRDRSMTNASAARILLGLGPALSLAHRPPDPVQEEWDLRWDTPTMDSWARGALTYLRGALSDACDHHPYIDDFAVSLRTLTGALRYATGNVDDLMYLGRCPEPCDDRSFCGAQLWHDAQHDVVTCPRCHSETGYGERRQLADRIHRAFPIDRRLRYHQALINTIAIPACSCGTTMIAEWVDVTTRQDSQRFYQIGSVTCPRCTRQA
jgi:hypothetical protein